MPVDREHLTERVRHVRQARVRRVTIRAARFLVGFRSAERVRRARRRIRTWVIAHTRVRARSLECAHRVSRRAHWAGA